MPTKPSTPPPVASLIAVRWGCSPDFSRRWPLPWAAPAAVAPEIAALARDHAAALDSHLTPMDRRRLVARVTATLAGHFVPDMPGPVMEAVIADWADDLGEFPEWAIAEAFRAFRRTEDRRPTIAAIRALCQPLVEEAAVELERCRRLLALGRPADQPTP